MRWKPPARYQVPNLEPPMTATAEAIDALHAATAIYTREPVVRDLVERSGWPECGGRFFDPSCGDGAFLVTAIEMLDPQPGDMATLSRVVGWELHPGAVAEAQERVSTTLINLGWNPSDARLAAGRLVLNRDFITDDLAEVGPVRVIGGNPPYLRFSRLPDVFKAIYGDSLPKAAKGDLQHAFLHRCVGILEVGSGRIAFVTADRWLGNQTASDLRASLGETLGITHIGRLDASTAFYRPKARVKNSPPRVHPVSILLSDRTIAGQYPLTGAPVSPDGYDRPAWTGPTLESIATVRIAPWLGAKGIFVLPNNRADEFEGIATLPVIDSDNLDVESRTLRAPTHFVLVTDRKEQPTGIVRDHIMSQFDNLPKRCRDGRWWHPPEAITIQLDRPALVIPRIGKRLTPIRVPAGVLPCDHSIYLAVDKDGLGLDRIEEILLSDETHDYVCSTAPRLEDGYFDIRSTLIRSVPIRS